MAIDIIPVRPEHAPELARICFDAFGALQDRHGTPRDFESLDIANALFQMLVTNPAVRGFAALARGTPVGSNFIHFLDDVAGVGPITVAPDLQGRGVGRSLMQAVLDEAAHRGVSQVRLLQEAVNTTSLSLYASLGFQWRDSIAIMQAGGHEPAAHVRPMTAADLDAVAAISRAHYGSSRRNEVSAALSAGLPALVCDRGDGPSAYLLPGFMGHGFAPDDPQMGSLVSHAAAHAPPGFHRVFAPLSNQALFQRLLRQGCRTIKIMSYMTIGPYTAPIGAWMPSILN